MKRNKPEPELSPELSIDSAIEVLKKAFEREKARKLAEATAAIERDMAAKFRAVLNQASDPAGEPPLKALEPVATIIPEAAPQIGSQYKDGVFDGTLGSLIHCYQTDPDSAHNKKRYQVRKNHDFTLRRIAAQYGRHELKNIKARLILAWHNEWIGPDRKKVAMAHSFIGHLRALCTFGMTLLDDPECVRLRDVLREMRFEVTGARSVRLTAKQADAIRAKAHEKGLHSIALAQAFQFETGLKQKIVIGEWMPATESGEASDILNGDSKWVRGLRWSDIDGNLILRRQAPNKKDAPIELDLKNTRMIREELSFLKRPVDGPMVICEQTLLPWRPAEFRRKWRIIATAAGVPTEVRNMDSFRGPKNSDLRPSTDAVVEDEDADVPQKSIGADDKERLIH